MQLEVIVDSHLRFSDAELPAHAKDMLWNALAISDPEDPGSIPLILAHRNSLTGQMQLPRGFALKLKKGLAAYGIQVSWIDRRTLVPSSKEVFSISSGGMSPRPYQVKAIERMATSEQGILEMPTGAGKTFSATTFLCEARQRSIVLVNKINLVDQWGDRIEQATGSRPGTIGDGTWEEKDITIAVYQTLYSRRADLDAANWWETWGALVLDECHAISGATVQEIIQRFPAYFRIGLSATPDRESWQFMLSRSIIGEIINRTTDEELEAAGVLIRPQIIAVKTPFEFPWTSLKSAQTQYAKLIKTIKTDDARNRRIAEILAAQRGHSCLVQTDHVEHAVELVAWAHAAGWPDDRVWIMTGDHNAKNRAEILARASNESDYVLVTTIGKEALDIPRLDRFFIVFPSKQDTGLKQMVGRLRRVHPTKTEAPIVYDFYDERVGPLKQQFAKRRGFYDREKLSLTII